MSDFRPRKKRVAAYFNNGEYIFSIWAKTDGTKGSGRARLIAAVNAARERFNEVYAGLPEPTKEAVSGSDAQEGGTEAELTPGESR